MFKGGFMLHDVIICQKFGERGVKTLKTQQQIEKLFTTALYKTNIDHFYLLNSMKSKVQIVIIVFDTLSLSWTLPYS